MLRERQEIEAPNVKGVGRGGAKSQVTGERGKKKTEERVGDSESQREAG